MVREKVRGSPITRMEDYDSKEHTRTARSMAKAPRLVVNMVNGSTSGNLRRASSGKVSTPREGPPLLIQRVLRRPPTNVRHLRQSQEVHCVGGAFAVKLPHQILCADVCGTLDTLNGGVDRSTEISDRRNSRYGVPFSTRSV